MIKYNIGIDMGTSSIKLILIDNRGNVLNQVGEEYEISQPKEGWKEIDPNIWFEKAKKGLKKLLQGIDIPLIEGIGITGQMHSIVFLDEKGDSIRPAIMWNDVRTKDNIQNLKNTIRNIPSIAHIANIISTGSPAANLLWLKDNEPQNFQKLNRFLIGPDYLVYRMTGKFSTDYCEASTSSLYNLEKDEWSEEMRDLLGLSPAIYPPICGSGEIVGEVKKELREAFGFSEEAQVIAGTGDNPAAAISTGCLTRNYPVLSLGTSGVFMIPKEKVDFSLKGKNIKFSIDGQEIVTLVQGVVQSVGSSVDWWMKKILKAENIGEEMEKLKTQYTGSHLFFYPHLVGDKTIYADPYLRGAFLGLGTEVRREEMILAVMEGICYAVKEVTDEMKIAGEIMNPLKITGGGAKNNLWMQMMADILGVCVEQLEGNTGAGLGMALLAGASCKNIANLSEISERLIQVKETFYPNEERRIFYADKYVKYRKIYRALKEID